MEIKRPFLTYTGSKFRLYNFFLKNYIPPHDIYCEPFGGGAAVLMLKPRARNEFYNDIEGRVVRLFKALQDKRVYEDLKHKLIFTPYAKEEMELAHDLVLHFKDNVPQTHEEKVEDAWATFLTIWMCRDPDCMNQHNRSWHHTKAAAKKPRDRSRALLFRGLVDNLDLYTDRMRGVEIRQQDFREILEEFRRVEHALVYLDPPYLISTIDKRGYYGGERT